MNVEELLDSSAGRRAIAAMKEVVEFPLVGHEDRFDAIANALLSVLLSDTCSTCGGRGEDVSRGYGDGRFPPCPDCKDDKVTPALVSGRHAEHLFAQGDNMARQAVIDTRAEIAEEIRSTARLAAKRPGSEPFQIADFIERRE